MGAWQEIADYTVPSTTSTIDIDLSSTPLTKDDFYMVNLTINSVLGPGFTLYANGNYTNSNYWHQNIRADGTSVNAARINTPQIEGGTNGVSNYNHIYLKISENNRFNYFANIIRNISSSVITSFYYGTSTFEVTSLTSLRIQGIDSLGAGSRIQIYKLAAEKVADITVASNTTQVDIANLSIGKDSEYLLVSDWTGTHNIGLYPNDLTTTTNYWSQLLFGNGSSASGERINQNRVNGINNSSSENLVAYTHIKLSEIGAYTFQTYIQSGIGTSVNRIANYFVSSTSEAITSITKFNIVSSASNQITAGSRFILYKLK